MTTIILLIQSVGIATFSTIPFLSSSLSLACTLCRRATGTRRGVCCTGLTLGSVMMAVSPIWPKPSKTSGTENLISGQVTTFQGMNAPFRIYIHFEKYQLLTSFGRQERFVRTLNNLEFHFYTFVFSLCCEYSPTDILHHARYHQIALTRRWT